MKKKMLMVTIVLFSGLIATCALAGGPKKISKCKAITKSGSYVVSKNLDATAKNLGHCIIIDTDYVTLDLNGFTLTGHDTIKGHGIWDNDTLHRGIIVRNGIIKEFSTGISLDSSSNGRIEKINVHGNTEDGITAGPGFIVNENIAVDNGSHGFGVDSGSTVTENVARGNDRGFSIFCPVNIMGNTSMNNTTANYSLYNGTCNSVNNLNLP